MELIVPSEVPSQPQSLDSDSALGVLDRRQRPLRDLRISVTDRCNFRCDYCMPAAKFADESRFLPQRELLGFNDIARVARVAVHALGARKLRITGGEPLLRPRLHELVTRLRAIDPTLELTLTTNGYLLSEQASALRAAGLSRITVSLDSVCEPEFERMSGGVAGLARVLLGIDAASRAGFGPLKINCVVVRGRNEPAIEALCEHFRGTPHIVRFIEYMDVGTQNSWQREHVVTAAEILGRVTARWPLVPLQANYAGEVARRYRYLDGAGEIGVIASVSDPFCGACHRARLSADGRFLTCLFAANGVSLKPLLGQAAQADDAALRALLTETWRARADAYSEQRATLNSSRTRRRLEMYQVGG